MSGLPARIVPTAEYEALRELARKVAEFDRMDEPGEQGLQLDRLISEAQSITDGEP